jgi:ubiquinone/menaquinone biosynthesis C-methylase UbiE
VLPFHRGVRRLAPQDAYRLWSESYDAQPDNVVLALEQEIYNGLLSDELVTDQVVVDIGCGTGRHWGHLLARRPRVLHGVDSSPEMLARLRARYPGATLHLRTGKRLDEFSDTSVDLVVSTLMLGHVREVEDELREWARLLRPGGEIIVTDFHPEALRAGAKRTFIHWGATFEVESHVHTVEALQSLFGSLDLDIVRFQEKTYGQPAQPLVLGFRLRRTE